MLTWSRNSSNYSLHVEEEFTTNNMWKFHPVWTHIVIKILSCQEPSNSGTDYPRRRSEAITPLTHLCHQASAQDVSCWTPIGPLVYGSILFHIALYFQIRLWLATLFGLVRMAYYGHYSGNYYVLQPVKRNMQALDLPESDRIWISDKLICGRWQVKKNWITDTEEHTR